MTVVVGALIGSAPWCASAGSPTPEGDAQACQRFTPADYGICMLLTSEYRDEFIPPSGKTAGLAAQIRCYPQRQDEAAYAACLAVDPRRATKPAPARRRVVATAPLVPPAGPKHREGAPADTGTTAAHHGPVESCAEAPDRPDCQPSPWGGAPGVQGNQTAAPGPSDRVGPSPTPDRDDGDSWTFSLENPGQLTHEGPNAQ